MAKALEQLPAWVWKTILRVKELKKTHLESN